MHRVMKLVSLITAAILMPVLQVALAQQDAPAPSDAKPKSETATAAEKNTDTGESMCLMIESAAKANGLPLEFFARVIWQESRFQPDAIGPVTLDPFDPVQALPKAAEFLSELRQQFGNLGLAAAAYNAGPRRVSEWRAGTGPMPEETRNYVYAITGASVEDWNKAGVGNDIADRKKPTGCRELMALLRHAPNPFVAHLEERVRIGAESPWGVQLAAGFSRDKALAMYARAMARVSGVIGDHDPNLLSSTFRSRGTRAFYQVRIGAETREAANDLCAKIHKAGQACMVLRNNRG
jgi:hypothetical protein